MIRLVSRGRFTHDFVKALIGAPEDREPVVRKTAAEFKGMAERAAKVAKLYRPPGKK